MKKNGFTLIELLAVIVILAIIALIAVPIVLNIIEDTKNSALLRSADFYLDAVELSIAEKVLEGGTIDGEYTINSSGNICKNEDCIEVEVSGQKPTGGKIIIEEGKIKSIYKLTLDNKKVSTDSSGNLAIKEYSTYLVTYTNINNTSNLPTSIEDGENVIIDLTGKNVPEGKLQVKVNGTILTEGYTYDGSKLIIDNVTGNVEVTRVLDTYTITYNGIDGETDLPNEATEGATILINLTSYNIAPDKLTVKMKDVEITEYSYTDGWLTITGVNGNITIDVKTKTTLVQYLKDLYNPNDTSLEVDGIIYNVDTENSLMQDRFGSKDNSIDTGNIRYYGANPNNYIDIGDREASNNPILWRIIGVFEDITVVDEEGNTTTEDLVKVIRADKLTAKKGTSTVSAFSFDYVLENDGDEYDSSNGYYYNNKWADSTLMTMLNSNDGYYGSGTEYNFYNNSTTASILDFTGTGLSSAVHNKIAKVQWNIDGHSSSSAYANTYYGKERQGTTWPGKVGLMYASDYGYGANLKECNRMLFFYDNSTCKTNNWLYDSTKNQWTITPDSSNSSYVWNANAAGHLCNHNANYQYRVRPVLYLNSNVELDEEVVPETGQRYYKIK